MATTNSSGFITCVAGEAIPANRRVVLVGANEVELAPVGVKGIGVSFTGTTAAEQPITVQLFSQGTVEVGVDSVGTPAAGSPAFTADSGLVSATAGSPSITVGIFREPGAGLDTLEVIPA